jgi:hypothetical protein
MGDGLRRAAAAARATRKPRRRRDEAVLQTACVDFYRKAIPHGIIFHIPNGEKRDKATAGRLKAMGVLAGVWDLGLVLPQGGIGFVEMKEPKKGALTAEQLEFRDAGLEWGAQFAECRSIEEFEAILRAWYPRERLRASVLAQGMIKRDVR